MRILHYSLGFPPYRTGGMTKFCMDIMLEQLKMGHNVMLLWPGQMRAIRRTVYIKKRNSQKDIGSYEVINPLPVSFDEGILCISAFTASCDKSVYIEFLRKIQPDVIHVHTLMGLHKEFLEAAKKLKIKTVFSIHDFFSICPKVTMFREGGICNSVENCKKCPQCNLSALSLRKIFLLQSPIYRNVKDSLIVRQLRSKHRDQYLSGRAEYTKDDGRVQNSDIDYLNLRKYYSEMILLFDKIHANSTVTRDVFKKFFDCASIELINITHSDIRDCRKKKQFSGDKLRISYLGPAGGAKGFFCSRRLSIKCG